MRHEFEQSNEINGNFDKDLKLPVINVSQTFERLQQLPNIEAPQNKQQKNALRQIIQTASAESPVTIYVGSCPDYSHKDGLYTHEGIGEGVPLLSQVHMQNDLQLIKTLEESHVPYEYVLMVADVEAIDEVFAQKFTSGDKVEFLRRCSASSRATQTTLDILKFQENLTGKLRSSSFFTEFGYDNFMAYQQQYMDVLFQKYDEDTSFRQRVNNDIVTRMDMYRRMYDTTLPSLGFQEAQAFLVYRDIRTKAQYLTLGKAMAEKSRTAIVINHPTTNLGFINDRNRYLLPTDDNKPQRTIPTFKMNKNVY